MLLFNSLQFLNSLKGGLIPRASYLIMKSQFNRGLILSSFVRHDSFADYLICAGVSPVTDINHNNFRMNKPDLIGSIFWPVGLVNIDHIK